MDSQLPNLSALALLAHPTDVTGAIDKSEKRKKMANAPAAPSAPKRPKEITVIKAAHADAERDLQGELVREGYVVFPTALATDDAIRLKTQQNFFQHLRESPELRDANPDDPTWTPVLGGFGGMGNPSSFHHPHIRLLREQAEAEVLEHNVLPLNGRKLEKTFDRCLYRIEGEKPTAETMHRDEAITAKAGDDIFGGWLNLESDTEFFSCVPRTHTTVGGQNKGFAQIPKEQWPQYWPHFRHIEIPAGYMVVFYERLVHEVLATATQRRMYRMHLGWRVTDYDTPLFGKELTMQWIQDQAVPKIKSGQDPLVVPKSYSNFSMRWPKYQSWSRRTFVDACLYQHTVAGGGEYVGQVWTRVKPKMNSLKEYGLPLHPVYEQSQIDQLFPHTSASLYTFASPNERVLFQLPTAEGHQAYLAALDAVGPGERVARIKPFVVVVE